MRLRPGTVAVLLLVLLGALPPAAAQATSGAERSGRTAAATVLTARLSSSAVPLGTRVTITGAVTPTRPGGRIVLERQTSGTWRAVTSGSLTASSTYQFNVTPNAAGWWRYRVSVPAQGGHTAATATLPALDAFRVVTYSLTTKGRPTTDLAAFRSAVAQTYGDRRGWLASHRRFVPVAKGGLFTVVLSEARYLPTFSSVCSVQYSCRVGRYVVINDDRWRQGSKPFTGPLEQYRQMVLNHETGHWLGLGHAGCPRAGALAPVMQQQSKGLGGCRPNAWPLRHELAAVS